jgi:hypothetical protein
MSRWVALKERWGQTLEEYGRVAIGTYFAIFGLVLVAFWVAIATGFRAESAAGNSGSLAAAYLATKLTQPLRIAATLGLTPLVARFFLKRTSGRPE